MVAALVVDVYIDSLCKVRLDVVICVIVTDLETLEITGASVVVVVP